MKIVEKAIEFIPTQYRQPPPIKYLGKYDGSDLYTWYITEDEYLRLNKLFGRDFQETGLGGTVVEGVPSQCYGCGKYHEFIDWVWTALQRGVHSSEFMFKALRNGRQGDETKHDVYCSECGLLTAARSRDNSEGGEANISLAGRLDRARFQPKLPRVAGAIINNSVSPKVNSVDYLCPSPFTPQQPVVWGKWWLDDNGRVRSLIDSKNNFSS